jgi:hypothetical protein
MRHLKAGRKLGRSSSHRDSLYRNLVAALLSHDRIKTTEEKAKEIRRFADRMVTLGKTGPWPRGVVRWPCGTRRPCSACSPTSPSASRTGRAATPGS